MPNITRTFQRTLPPGMILPLAGLNVPYNMLLCDGQAIDRALYADLFAAIGLIYGSGDGTTTFNLPDMNGQYIRGLDEGSGVDVTDPARALGSKQLYAAALPTTPISVAMSSDGSHDHLLTMSSVGNHRHAMTHISNDLGTSMTAAEGEFTSDGPLSSVTGAHTHAITGYSSEAHTHTVLFNANGETEPEALVMRSVITL